MASISTISAGVPQGSTGEDERAITSLLSRLESSGVPINAPGKPSVLERLLDMISRPGYATTSALQAGLQGKDPMQVAQAGLEGLMGKRKTTFRDVLEKDLGVQNIKIPYFPDTNTLLGLAGDIALDPTTYLSFGVGTGLKTIGKAGARKMLTRAGEEALTTKASQLAARLTRRAAGRAGEATIGKAAGTMAEQALLERAGTAAGKNLFEQGGVKFAGQTVVPGATIRKTASDLVSAAKEVPLFGKVIDYSQKAVDVVKDIAGYSFTPGYQFTKQIKKLTDTQKAITKTMGLTEKEAVTVFPELSSEVQDALQWVSKNKRFAANQGYKQMIDIFAGINPEEGKLLAEALEKVPGAADKLSDQGKNALTGVQTLLKEIAPEQLKYGFITRLVKNYNPRYMTNEAKKYLQENLGKPDSSIRGLIKIFQPKKGKERVLIAPDIKEGLLASAKTAGAKKRLDEKLVTTFFNEPLKKNTIEEINEITSKKLGFKWFEEDLTKALPKYYTDFITNKAMFEGLQDLPRLVNDESGYKIFQQYGKGAVRLPGYKEFSLDPLKGFQGPSFLVDQIQQTYKMMSNADEINTFMKGYDKAMRYFKFGVTVPFPAFHSQNFIGGQFALYEYGLTPGSAQWTKRMNQARSMLDDQPTLFNAAKAAKLGAMPIDTVINEGKIKGLTLGDLRNLYEQYGGSTGLFHGDVGESVYRKIFSNQQPLVQKGVSKLVDIGSNTGAFVEDLNRLPIFIEEMVKHGDPRRATKEVFKYQFDYAPEAYTTVEREVFSRLIPFYKFMRGNIPLQLNTLYGKTGRINAIAKAVRDLGGGEDVDKPEWLRSQFSVKLPPEIAKLFGRSTNDKVFVTLPFPFAEIGKVDPKTLLSQITPVLKIPLELLTNQSLFFGNHIWNPDLPSEAQTSKAYPILKPLTQIPLIGDGLAKVMKWREKPMVDSSGKPTGVVYYEADPMLVYALKQMLGPISRAYILFGQMPDASLAANLSEFALPFGVVPVNPDEAVASRMATRRRELSELVGYYKARGMVSPEAPKNKPPLQEEAQKYLKDVLYGQ